MVSQLSTSEAVSQPNKTRFSTNRLRRLLVLVLLPALSVCTSWSVAQSPNFDVLIEPLTAIDRQFMAEQRMRVEQLANRLGRGLTGVADRDLDTLQRILDERMVPAEDTLTLQAMGVVFGDLLGDRLDNLPDALALARRTLVKVRQNLAWAFGYNLIVLPIAAGALLPGQGLLLSPPLAALLMALSSITVVLNALALRIR